MHTRLVLVFLLYMTDLGTTATKLCAQSYKIVYQESQLKILKFFLLNSNKTTACYATFCLRACLSTSTFLHLDVRFKKNSN